MGSVKIVDFHVEQNQWHPTQLSPVSLIHAVLNNKAAIYVWFWLEAYVEFSFVKNYFQVKQKQIKWNVEVEQTNHL